MRGGKTFKSGSSRHRHSIVNGGRVAQDLPTFADETKRFRINLNDSSKESNTMKRLMATALALSLLSGASALAEPPHPSGGGGAHTSSGGQHAGGQGSGGQHQGGQGGQGGG